MTFTAMTFRSLAIATAALAATASAQALTLPTNALVAESVQTFSDEAVQSFALTGTVVTPLGNAFAVPNTTASFDLPVTSIVIGSTLKVESGTAQGSALEIARMYKATPKSTPVRVGLTLANFTINYKTKQVLADTTPIGGTTLRQASVYDYTINTPLGVKYQFPLGITLHEVLDTLMLTPSALDTFTAALALKSFERDVISSISFGDLTQDIKVKFRAKPLSTKPYTPAP